MEKRKIVIQDLTNKVRFSLLSEIAQAIEVQLNRDVAPQWGVGGIVRVFSKDLESTFEDFWKVTIQESIENGYNGVHWYNAVTGIPYAQVRLTDWNSGNYSDSHLSKVISEEIVEMAIDPRGDKIAISRDLQNSGQVEYLIELGDPVANVGVGYYINDVFVTNFIYPSYFNLTHVKGTKYDHLGLLQKPLSLLDKSYQLFRRAGVWYRALMVKGKVLISKASDRIAYGSSSLFWLIPIIIIIVFIIYKVYGTFKRNRDI